MTLISTTTLTGASVTLSSIPGTYNNLQIIVDNFLPSTVAALNMRINNDSGSNRYDMSGSFFGSDTQYTQSSIQMIRYPSSSATTSTCIIDIPNYANSTMLKTGTRISIGKNPSTDNYNYFQGQWVYNQIAAITSLTFFPDAGSFTSGSIRLFGVK